jgi:neopullulanase
MRRFSVLLALLAVAGCCGDPPEWLQFDPIELEEGEGSLELLDWISDDRGDLEFEADSDESGLIAWVEGSTLMLQAQPEWEGTAWVTLITRDQCDQEADTDVQVIVGEPGDDDDDDTVDPFVDPCGVTLVYEAQTDPETVAVAGPFNDWSTESHPMEEKHSGEWEIYIPGDEFEPGAYPYKFVELDGAYEAWNCDPRSGLIHCDEGYKAPDDTTWTQDCTVGEDSCNSMFVVRDFDQPRLVVDELDIDHEAGDVTAQVTFRAGCAGDEAASWSATLDGAAVDDAWTGDGFEVALTGLAEGRHTIRLDVEDGAGRAAEQVFVPLWVEPASGWDRGVMYYAFMDRFANGDTGIDTSEGASVELAGYMGGDLWGLVDALPYLEDLGVNIIWISNPQDNAEGAWAGDCGTYSGYHGYWPDDPYAVEEHYGGDAALRALVDGAHGRSMRVVMDWVCNHVHQDHPYYQQHPDWFNEPVMCRVGEDYSNFDLIPETCWFAEYLPDIRFYEPEVLDVMVEDAIWWAREYDLDGFRVDGAKHVPHSVIWNVTTRIDQAIEHGAAGGSTEFYTVGETFTFDRNLIVAYVNEHELDAQFDFPLYGTVRAAFVDDSATLTDLDASMAASNDAYGGALMSTFLGNHDVSRFTSYGQEGGWADSLDSSCFVADVIGDTWWYSRLNLAWTYLLTQPGIPLIYYGDEIGMPGYHDPDNRHPLDWYSSALAGGTGGEFTVADLAAGLYHPEMEQVLWHLADLGSARAEHPAFWSGDETQWWADADTLAYGRVAGDDAVLVILHRGWWETTLENGLTFAGLDGEATYTDILTGETFQASGDWISVPMAGNSARVLVP